MSASVIKSVLGNRSRFKKYPPIGVGGAYSARREVKAHNIGLLMLEGPHVAAGLARAAKEAAGKPEYWEVVAAATTLFVLTDEYLEYLEEDGEIAEKADPLLAAIKSGDEDAARDIARVEIAHRWHHILPIWEDISSDADI